MDEYSYPGLVLFYVMSKDYMIQHNKLVYCNLSMWEFLPYSGNSTLKANLS